MIENLVIFGATGDVTKRYVFPALAELMSRGRLSGTRSIVGIGRREWTTPQFQEYVSEFLGQHRPSFPKGSREGLLSLLQFVQVEDLSDPQQIRKVFKYHPGSRLLYLGLPSQVFGPVLKALSRSSEGSSYPIILEKPFGLNVQEARTLNRLLHQQYPEDHIFRLDHFLGMPVVSHILNLRFRDHRFQTIWNREYIQKIEIIWDETLALEGRAGYYDRAGALKDMIQNHLLQLMALLAMNFVSSPWAPDFRDKKVQLFQSIQPLTLSDIKRHTIRARYRSGQVEGKRIPDYAREKDVDPERKTETFAQIILYINNARWEGVPFVLRSGKALGRDRKEISVYFKGGNRIEASPWPEDRAPILHFNLGTDDMIPEWIHKDGQEKVTVNLMDNGFGNASSPLSPYGGLLLEAMCGNTALFIRNDEVEAMWKVVQPIVDAWAENVVPLHIYRAGSDGPVLNEPVKSRTETNPSLP